MKFRGFPRIHIGLLDLGKATRRAYGGAGFFINGLVTELNVNPKKKLSIKYNIDIDLRGKEIVRIIIEKVKNQYGELKGEITLINAPKQHIGLGSKTTMLMSIVKSIDLVNQLHLDSNIVVALSERGGSSGIGVNGFSQGGFIVDGGHPQNDIESILPSSFRVPKKIPPIISRFQIPDCWRISLFFPSRKRYDGIEEKLFFEENTPLCKQEVLDSIAILYHGISPSVATNDLEEFATSLSEFHRVGFKKRELKAQSSICNKIYKKYSVNAKCAIGLSSMGPVLYIVTEVQNQRLRSDIIKYCSKYGVEHIGEFKGRNEGYEVQL